MVRATGAVLLAAAALAARALPGQTGPGAYVLALVLFACGSGGSAMLALGIHLFDQVEVSPRWLPQGGRR